MKKDVKDVSARGRKGGGSRVVKKRSVGNLSPDTFYKRAIKQQDVHELMQKLAKM